MVSKYNRRARRTTRRIKRILAVALLVVAVVELASAGLIESGILAAQRPSYRMPKLQPFWIDRDPHVGAWHEADTEYEDVTDCYAVTYRTNAYGARDPERKRKGDSPRVVMLGDGFIEGVGLQRGARISDILEAETKAEHLNFGSGGHFGATQAWLLYKHLAKGFDHDLVVFGLVPDDDFVNDDPALAAAYGRQYRPYLVMRGGSYYLKYVNPDERGLSVAERRAEDRRLVARLLASYTYTANAVRRIGILAHANWTGGPGAAASAEATYSGYFDFTQAQAERLVHILEQLLDEAGDRQVIVAVIPRPADFQQAAPPPLSAILDVLAPAYPNLHVIDLRERFKQDAARAGYYRNCRRFFSPAGAAAAAGALLADPVYRAALGLK